MSASAVRSGHERNIHSQNSRCAGGCGAQVMNGAVRDSQVKGQGWTRFQFAFVVLLNQFCISKTGSTSAFRLTLQSGKHNTVLSISTCNGALELTHCR